MRLNQSMTKFIIGVIFGFILACGIVWASEVIVDFSARSVPILNEELRIIRATLRDHETRLTAHGL